MHLSCYKIKFHYYYLFSPLRRTSTFFTSCVSKSYKSCTDVTDIHLPHVEASHLSSDPFHPHTFPCSPFSSRIVFFFPSVFFSLALAVPSPICQVRRRHTPGIVLILSYVVAAIVSSLRSSAIPLTAAYVSNACHGMSGDSLRKVEYAKGKRTRECNVVRIKGGIIGN